MPFEILLTEWYGSGGPEMAYVKAPESNKLTRLDSSLTGGGLLAKLRTLLYELLLPRGYPDSVSQDYAEYQLWDTLQAFASTLGHALATHAVLLGVGVGDKEASALSAAVTWIFKDGVGMLSKVAFAWWKGSAFDSDCKKWRLCADALNDAAMTVEVLLLPLISNRLLEVLCITSAMKAVVGVAGGATRAAVTQHQALSNNTGDVSAKDSSQETCVNLVASLVGLALLSHLGNTSLVYPIFTLIICLHLYSNYRAVRALKFKVLNPERFHLVLYHYLTGSYVPAPEAVAGMESVNVFSGLTELKLTGYRMRLGSSLQGLDLTSNQLRMISSLYKDRKFLLVQSSACVRAVLSRGAGVRDTVQAYFHALMLAAASSHSMGAQPAALFSANLAKHCSWRRFLAMFTNLRLRSHGELLNIGELMEMDSLCTEEFSYFWKSLETSGWSLSSHQLHGVDEGWRASWGPLLSH